MQPVGKVEILVVHRDQKIGDERRHWNGPAFYLNGGDIDNLFNLPLTVGLVPVPHIATECGSDEAVGAVRIMVEAHLQWDQSFLTQINTLDEFMILPVPEVQVVTVLPTRDIIQIEAFGIGVRRCPFTADHDIVTRLVPEVIVVVDTLGFVFPTPRYVELLVKQQETTGSVALLITEHRDHNMTIG